MCQINELEKCRGVDVESDMMREDFGSTVLE